MDLLCIGLGKWDFTQNSRAECEVSVICLGHVHLQVPCFGVQAGTDCALTMTETGIYFRVSKPTAS